MQQFYLTAMLQMGAGTQEGQRPRVDIVGARSTIDLLGVLAEKTRGNLTATEDRMLQTVLFEARMAFLELTSMMTVQPVQPPPRCAAVSQPAQVEESLQPLANQTHRRSSIGFATSASLSLELPSSICFGTEGCS